MPLTDHRFTLELEQTGEKFADVLSYDIDSSYLTPTDAWSCVIYWGEDRAAELRRKFRPLSPVRVYIDGQCQVIGRIDKIEGTGNSGAALQISGRDYLADIVDGGVDPTIRFTKGMDLGQAILKVVEPFGIKTIFNGGFNFTRNILTGKKPFGGAPAKDFKAAKLEEFKPSDGQGAFECANRIAARHGFTLQPAGTRDSVVLAAPEYRQQPLYPLRRPGNVIRASCSRDYSDVPAITIARGRGGEAGAKVGSMYREVPTYGVEAPTEIGRNAEVKEIVFGNAAGTAPRVFLARNKPGAGGIAPGVLYRPLYYKDEDSRNQAQLDAGVRRMICERLRKTLEYTCTLRGHVDIKSGALYAIDTIADVLDGVEDVNEHLWVESRRFANDGGGPITELKLIRPDSFVI